MATESELREEINALRNELATLSDWADGAFSVFTDLLPFLLRADPVMAEQLGEKWRKVAERYDFITGPEHPDEDDEPPERMKMRKILYRTLVVSGSWPGRTPV